MAIERTSIDIDSTEVKLYSKNSLNLYIYNSLHAKELIKDMLKDLKIKDKSISSSGKITFNIDNMAVSISLFNIEDANNLVYTKTSRNFILFPCSVKDNIEYINTAMQYLCYHQKNKEFIIILDLIHNIDGAFNALVNGLSSTFRSKNKILERQESGEVIPRSRFSSQSENAIIANLKNICKSNNIRSPSVIGPENYMLSTIKAFFKHYEKYVDEALRPIESSYEKKLAELNEAEKELIGSIEQAQKRLLILQKEKEQNKINKDNISDYAKERKSYFEGFRGAITNKSTTIRGSSNSPGTSPPSNSSYSTLLKSSDSFRDRGSIRMDDEAIVISTPNS